MVFRNETEAVTELAEMILDASANLFKATKYIYSLSKNDFYNCDIKDAFKVILNNIFDAGALRALNLTMDNGGCSEMNSPEYNRAFSLLVYSFAVRIPVLQQVQVNGSTLTDQQLRAVYDAVMAKGVVNHDDTVQESYDAIRRCIKRREPVPPYTAEWYKTFLCRSVPELGDITNRNLFLFGTVDVLFVLFSLRLEQELERQIQELAGSVRQGR